MGCEAKFDLQGRTFNLYFERFRWVFCQLEVLRCCFPTNLRRTLNELPKSLDETYMRVLKNINNANWEQTRRLLQCLMVAHRPLRVEELAEVLAFDFTAGGTPKTISDWRLEDREEAVLSACSSLVSVISDRGSRVVQFSHFSVKEFLTSERLTSRMEEESRFYIPIERSHAMLAQACLGVLMCLDDHTDEESAEKMPLFRYAANYWHQHAQIGNVELEIADSMDYFFDTDRPHFAAWVRLKGIRKVGIPYLLILSRDDSVSPVCVAAGNGFRGLVERLIMRHPQQINHSDGSFGTPLHALAVVTEATDGGHLKVAQLLFEHGANINSLTSDDVTPLHVASQLGNLEIGNWLLDHGADVNLQMKDGRTSLHLAVKAGNLKVAQLLLEHHAEVNSLEDNDGFTPLLSAFLNVRADAAHLLLEYGADVHVCNKIGDTPLHLAARCGPDYLDVIRKLIELNADINSRNHKGSTPLLLASRHRHTGVLQLLLDHNADAHICDYNDNTPLHRAALNCRLEIARILLKHNVEVDARDASGSTPLHVIAGRRRGPQEKKDFAQLLLDHGADAQARNLSGQTVSWGDSYSDLYPIVELTDFSSDEMSSDSTDWDEMCVDSVDSDSEVMGLDSDSED